MAHYNGEVVKLDRGYPLVALDTGEELRCEQATALVKTAEIRAVVGDRVRVEIPDAHDKGIITQVAPRRCAFIRKDPTERTLPQVLAANFDYVFVAQPLHEVNLKRLERELVLAHETGAAVCVVLTKADLLPEANADAARVSEATSVDAVRARVVDIAGPHVPVWVVTETDATSFDPLRKVLAGESYLERGCTFDTSNTSNTSDTSAPFDPDTSVPFDPDAFAPFDTSDTSDASVPFDSDAFARHHGAVAVLIGRSGVGKSSLVNMLCGAQVAATQSVRDTDGRGRHTTTSRTLVDIPTGGCIIDMPGVRGVGMWEADEGISAAFSDITELAASCRFRDCQHINEPGCAVLAALENGTLSQARLDSYRLLTKESQSAQKRKQQAQWAQTDRVRYNSKRMHGAGTASGRARS